VVASALRAGVHDPRSIGEFSAWFGTDADCLDYLEWLRWPDGFVCPGCAHIGGWRLGDGRWECAGCGARTSPTAGTIFDRTPHAADGLVHGVLAVRGPEGRGLGAELAAVAGDRLLPDRVGDAAPAALGARAPGTRAPSRHGGGRRDLHRRRGARAGGRAREGQEVARRRGRRADRAERLRALPDGAAERRFDRFRCERSSSTTSRWARRSSPTAGSPTARQPRTCTPTSVSWSPAPRRRICCPACTGSPRWPSAGCWAPTRAPSTRPTWPAT